uniref:Serpentine receptor class gamma n=1 Tax=Meloidogyne floridensis TaxID=298350 RepID=A0A915NXH8_9BILA
MAISENPSKFMEFAVYYPAFFANFFINSLPITIGLEKLISTLFCKYYEKNKRLRFVGIGILAIQLITALLFSIIRFNLTSKENNSQNISSLQHTIFNNLQIILPQSSIILPNQNSPQNSISCRYQLRENCRTLRFCLFFVFLLGASTFIQILLHTFNDEESRTLFFNVNYSDKHFGTLEEFLALFPQTLALLGTLFGHKSIRLSLLSLFGFEVSAIERAVTKQNKNLHINTVNGSLSSSFSSNRTARVSDAKSVNELIRDAHFDILQNYWEKKT